METFAAEVWEALEARHPGSQLVAHGGNNLRLPAFFVRAWWHTLRSVIGRRCDLVLTGDAVTYIALWPLLALLRVRSITMVMGLDLTWPHRYYEVVTRALVPRATRVIAISTATAEAARAIGVAPDRCGIVRPAVAVPDCGSSDRARARRRLDERLGLPDDAVVLLTVGRLVARKGVRWFVAEVMPKLATSAHYVVAGSGPDRANIEHAITAAGLRAQVHLLGRVSEDEREDLLRGSDLFVQPNIMIAGDMEGFGLVVLEATSRGTPVVASALEGLCDAVVDGETGYLVAPGDAEAWSTCVTRLTTHPARLVEIGARFRSRTIELDGSKRLQESLSEELRRCQRSTRSATVRSSRRS
jgi:phosphatidylinositol alpha-1,6-mannosyltransferase